MPAHKTYAKALCRKGHGYALWEPDPGTDPAVELADVGYVRDGGFIKLFNASLDAEDPRNRLGLPDGYEPCLISEVHRRTSLPQKDHISSEGVSEVGAQMNLSAG